MKNKEIIGEVMKEFFYILKINNKLYYIFGK